MREFPTNPTHGMLFEVSQGIFYQYDAVLATWIAITSSSNSLPLATDLTDGVMSADDLKKLNRMVVPPPQSTLIGNECLSPFSRGMITLYGSDFVKVEGTRGLRDGLDYETIPYHVHEHTFAYDFSLHLPELIQDLLERGQLKLKGAPGQKGKKGKKGPRGVDFILTGPPGATGERGDSPSCTTTISNEAIPVTTRPNHNMAIVGATIKLQDNNEYRIEIQRQAIGREQAATAQFYVKQQHSPWILAVQSLTATPQPIFYFDADPIVNAIRVKFRAEMRRLKQGYEEVVAFWVQTMSDLFDEQKAALCCALEFCMSKTKSNALREHMESVAAAASGTASITLHNRDSAEAVAMSNTRLLRTLGYEDACYSGPSFPQPPSPGGSDCFGGGGGSGSGSDGGGGGDNPPPPPPPPVPPPPPPPVPPPPPPPPATSLDFFCRDHNGEIVSGVTHVPGVLSRQFGSNWKPYGVSSYSQLLLSDLADSQAPTGVYTDATSEQGVSNTDLRWFIPASRLTTVAGPIGGDNPVEFISPPPTQPATIYWVINFAICRLHSTQRVTLETYARAIPLVVKQAWEAGTWNGPWLNVNQNGNSVTTSSLYTDMPLPFPASLQVNLSNAIYAIEFRLVKREAMVGGTRLEIMSTSAGVCYYNELPPTISPPPPPPPVPPPPPPPPPPPSPTLVICGQRGLSSPTDYPAWQSPPWLQNKASKNWRRVGMTTAALADHSAGTYIYSDQNTERGVARQELLFYVINSAGTTVPPYFIIDALHLICDTSISFFSVDLYARQIPLSAQRAWLADTWTGQWVFVGSYDNPDAVANIDLPLAIKIGPNDAAGPVLFGVEFKLVKKSKPSLRFNEIYVSACSTQEYPGTITNYFRDITIQGASLDAPAQTTDDTFGLMIDCDPNFPITDTITPINNFSCVNTVKIECDVNNTDADGVRFRSRLSIDHVNYPGSDSGCTSGTHLHTIDLLVAGGLSWSNAAPSELKTYSNIHRISWVTNGVPQSREIRVSLEFVASPQAAKAMARAAVARTALVVDPLLHAGSATNGSTINLSAGYYVAIIKTFSTKTAAGYHSGLAVRYGKGGRWHYAEFMDKGMFTNLADAQASYEGLTLGFQHDGGELAFYYQWLPQEATGNAVVIIEPQQYLSVPQVSLAPRPEPLKTATPVDYCSLPNHKIKWYEQGWLNQRCCGLVVSLGGQDYIVLKRSVGNDISCGGGESLDNPCLQAFPGRHPALAWPTFDGQTFIDLGQEQVSFKYQEELSKLVVEKINNGEFEGARGTQAGLRNLASQFSVILFPVV